MANEGSVLYDHIPISAGMEIYFCHMFDDHRYVSTHWHDAVEIIFLLDGELTVYQQEQKTYMEKNDIILINSGEFHATRCREGNESLLIQIPDRFMQKYIPESRIFNLLCTPDQPMPSSRQSWSVYVR